MSDDYRVRLTADNEVTDEARDAAKALDALPDKVTVQIDADTETPTRDIDGLLQKVDRLAGTDAANLILTSNAKDITNEVADLVQEIDRLDAADPEVQVKVDQIRQLETDLGRISDKAKEINGTPITLDTGPAVKGLSDVERSAGSSRSVLANMVGNATQDLGSLGGIAGSTGVAIGQMGEYMVDAANDGDRLGAVFKNFAAVAGPIALIAAGTAAASAVISRLGAVGARTAEAVGRTADALRKGGDAAENYAESLQSVGDVSLDVARSQSGIQNVVGALNDRVSGLIPQLGLLAKVIGVSDDETRSLVGSLSEVGLNVKVWTDLVMGGTDGYRELSAALKTTNLSAQDQSDILEGLRQAQTDFGTATLTAAEATRFFGNEAEPAAKSADEMAAAAEAGAQRVQDMADALAEAAVNTATANQQLEDLAGGFGELGRRQEALTSVFALGNAPIDLAAQVRDIDVAIGDLSDAAEDVDLSQALDPSNVKADGLLDALDALRPQIQTKIAEAFASGGPDAAKAVATGYVDQIVAELGGKLDAAEVEKLLGLTDLDAVVQVALDQSTAARVKSELDILTGLGGETPLTASIALALQAGTITPEAAEALVLGALGDQGVTVPSTLAPPASAEALAEAQAFLTGSPVQMPVVVDTAAVDAAFSDLTPAAVPVTADVAEAQSSVDGFVSDTEGTTPTVDVVSDVDKATADIVYLKLLSALLRPVVTVTADTGPAFAGLAAVAAQRPKVPVEAYLADYPTAAEIQARIGRPRIPVDIVVGSSIRITGVRD